LSDTDKRDNYWVIHLSEEKPLAEGRESKVFERPGKPSQLIKVRRQEVVEFLRASKGIKHRFRRRDGVGPYQIFLRQGRAYHEAMLRAAELEYPPPIAHQRGMILTDLGLGLVVQKIRDHHGGVAPTLLELARDGRINIHVIQALTRFAHEIRAFRIIVTDLDPRNLVYETRHGRSRIILVDGYGSRTFFPLRRWSKTINDRALLKKLQGLAEEIELDWDSESWSFGFLDRIDKLDAPRT
jgi:hypothetical protein